MLNIKHYQTAWLMSHKIRNAMVDRVNSFHLAAIAEISQSYVDSDKKPDNHADGEGDGDEYENKTLIAVCIENNSERPGYVSLRVINDAGIQGDVEQTSIVYGKERLVDRELTDKLDKLSKKSLKRLSEKPIVELFDVLAGESTPAKNGAVKNVSTESASNNESKSMSRKSKSQKPQQPSASEKQPQLKWVQTLMRNVKTTIAGVFHGVSKKHLQRFLDEYCFRFNRRHQESELFERLIVACSRTRTVCFAELNR
ncbi:MAG TPA: transposase [Chitinispirillaceae bacterium]|nr:transposase [Chitinispirillaceae bacterium]